MTSKLAPAITAAQSVRVCVSVCVGMPAIQWLLRPCRAVPGQAGNGRHGHTQKHSVRRQTYKLNPAPHLSLLLLNRLQSDRRPDSLKGLSTFKLPVQSLSRSVFTAL